MRGSVETSVRLTRPLSEWDESKDVLDAGDSREEERAIVNISIRLATAIGQVGVN